MSMPPSHKTRLLKTGAVLLCAGLFYGYVLLPRGIVIPCLFYRITGWRCPGCGITNLCLAMLHGRIAEAPAYNWGLVLSLPVLLWLVVYRRTEGSERREKAVCIGLLVFLLCWGVIRNLYGL